MAGATLSIGTRSTAELTTALFGEPLTIDEVLGRLAIVDPSGSPSQSSPAGLWVGSIGYEQHKDHAAFARLVRRAGVERLIDVRELPISRRRGFAKSALSTAMADVDVEYVHIKELGNPKPFRDLYRQGHVDEGRRSYRRHLLGVQRAALEGLVPLLQEKRSALMCFEHDPAVCHRTVIVEALREQLGVALEVAEIG